jgi:hypothetical protein
MGSIDLSFDIVFTLNILLSSSYIFVLRKTIAIPPPISQSAWQVTMVFSKILG